MKTALKFLFVLGVFNFCTGCSQQDNKPRESPMVTDDSMRKKILTKNDNPYKIVDISPMDISYCPDDYPKLKMDNPGITLPLARIIYSRPQLQGRRLFQNLIKHGEPWRLGANESTELELFQNAFIQDKKMNAGRYVLYCIPQPENWIIVLNSNIHSWGLHPDSTKDITRFVVPVKQVSNHLEYYTMIFRQIAGGYDLLIAWDNLEVRLPFKF